MHNDLGLGTVSFGPWFAGLAVAEAFSAEFSSWQRSSSTHLLESHFPEKSNALGRSWPSCGDLGKFCDVRLVGGGQATIWLQHLRRKFD